MTRIVKQAEERKNEILDVAQILFQQNGYNLTSTSQIAKTAKIAQGTLFYHFESKEILADALVERELKKLLTIFNTITANQKMSGFQKLAWFFVFELDDPHEHVATFNYMMHKENAVLQQKLSLQMINLFTPVLTEWLTQAKIEQSMPIQNPALTAEFFLTTFHHWIDGSLYQWTAAERIARIKAVQPFFEQLFCLEEHSLDLENLRQTLKQQH